MSKKVYYLRLPMPPTVNHYHVPRKGGKGLTKSAKARSYQRDAIMILRSLNLHREKIAQPVRLSITFHPKTNARYDVSNFLKVMEDSLVMGGLLEDDHWIEYDSINKGEKSKNGEVEIQINV